MTRPFSRGGIATLYASLIRFQRLYGSAGADLAAYLPFYPLCNYALLEDEQVSERPIRIFHGTADDVSPTEPCRQYVGRLRRAGKDVQLIEYAGVHHAFDDPSRAARYLPQGQSFRRCFWEERAGGQLVSRATGQPASVTDPCIARGATEGYDRRAHGEAVEAVKAFLTATFNLSE